MSSIPLELRQVMRADAFAQLLGFRLLDVAGATVEAAVTPAPEHANAGGVVHGGFLSALADWATGTAVHNAIPDGHYAPHASLTTQYLKVARPGVELRCTARCLNVTRKSASAEAELRQADAVIARVLSSHVLVERRDR